MELPIDRQIPAARRSATVFEEVEEEDQDADWWRVD